MAIMKIVKCPGMTSRQASILTPCSADVSKKSAQNDDVAGSVSVRTVWNYDVSKIPALHVDEVSIPADVSLRTWHGTVLRGECGGSTCRGLRSRNCRRRLVFIFGCRGVSSLLGGFSGGRFLRHQETMHVTGIVGNNPTCSSFSLQALYKLKVL